MKLIYSILLVLSVSYLSAQDLPYHDIPDYPETYTPATVTARLIDGLGYRYYWATEGLRDEDLQYSASETSRSTLKTLEHIHQLTDMIYNGIHSIPNGDRETGLTYEEMRSKTLNRLKQISRHLREHRNKQLSQSKIIFQRGGKTSEFPFWHQLNGPIADAIWHVGQVVANRRASGNPLSSKTNVFTGKSRD